MNAHRVIRSHSKLLRYLHERRGIAVTLYVVLDGPERLSLSRAQRFISSHVVQYGLLV